MPFRSLAQRRFMHARHPEIAKQWEKKTKKKKLPEKVSSEEKDEIEESFLDRLDQALNILEARSGDPQATTRPTLGARKGPAKGSPSRKYAPKKKKKEPIADG